MLESSSYCVDPFYPGVDNESHNLLWYDFSREKKTWKGWGGEI